MQLNFRLPLTVLSGLSLLLGVLDASAGVAYLTLLAQHQLSTLSLAQASLWGTAAALPLLWWGARHAARGGRAFPLAVPGLIVTLLAFLLFRAPSGALLLVTVALLATVAPQLEANISARVAVLEKSGRALQGQVHAAFALGAIVGALMTGFAVEHQFLPVVAFIVSGGALVCSLLGCTLKSPARGVTPQARIPRTPRATVALLVVTAVGAYFVESLVEAWGAWRLVERFA